MAIFRLAQQGGHHGPRDGVVGRRDEEVRTGSDGTGCLHVARFRSASRSRHPPSITGRRRSPPDLLAILRTISMSCPSCRRQSVSLRWTVSDCRVGRSVTYIPNRSHRPLRHRVLVRPPSPLPPSRIVPPIHPVAQAPTATLNRRSSEAPTHPRFAKPPAETPPPVYPSLLPNPSMRFISHRRSVRAHPIYRAL